MINRVALTALLCVLASGCATHRAYDGPARPAEEVATLSVIGHDFRIDEDIAVPPGTRTIELLPGIHDVSWRYVYPNGYPEDQSLVFAVEAGRRYRLGQRFFATPHPGGPLVDAAEMTVELVFTPFRLVGLGERPDAPPPGQYHAWIIEMESDMIVAGEPPDVPSAHMPITFVPIDEGPTRAAGVTDDAPLD